MTLDKSRSIEFDQDVGEHLTTRLGRPREVVLLVRVLKQHDIDKLYRCYRTGAIATFPWPLGTSPIAVCHIKRVGSLQDCRRAAK